MQERVRKIAPDVIFYDEVPVQTLETLETMFQRVFELSAGLESWFLIVDIRQTTPPGAEIRTRLQEIYAKLPTLRYVALITGLNRLLATVARFVAGNKIKTPFSMVKDFDAALEKINSLR